MEWLARKIVNNRKWVCLIFGILIIASIICIPFTTVNYDMTKYLPEDMPTSEALAVMTREYGNNGTCNLMIKQQTPLNILKYKKQIESVDGIKSAIWLDDMIEGMLGEKSDVELSVIIGIMATGGGNLPQDIKDMIEANRSQIEKFYKSNAANIQLIMQEGDYDRRTAKALSEIEKIMDIDIYMTGMSAGAYNSVKITNQETLKTTIIILPVLLLILFLATTSWIEPILFMIAIGVAVLINMGSNIALGSVSFLTQASAMILQMALAMDYSIFLLHRYKQEKLKGKCAEDAMITALAKSFSPISASSLTTIAGFVALMFMRYTIGLDMGIVLAKGILISLISVFVLMPAIIIYGDKLIKKTSHRPITLPTKALSTGIIKSRMILPIVIIGLIIPAFIGQGLNTFVYGEKATMGGEGSRQNNDRIATEEIFGINNPIVIILPKDALEQQRIIYRELKLVDNIESSTIQSYAFFLDQAIASQRDILEKDYKRDNPNATAQEIEDYLLAQHQSIIDKAETSILMVTSQLNSQKFTRIIANLLTDEEGSDAILAVESIKNMLSRVMVDGEYYITGPSIAALDIKMVVERDYQVVTIVSLLLVGLILLLTYKSAILPIILLAVIQGSIWLNMAIPFLATTPLIFIGYMIVSAVQLGATIDYGILFTSRYLENRKTLDKFKSVRAAYQQSTHSILTSGGILCSAGFILAISSSMSGMAAIGLMLGQGALLSVLLVLTLLPQLLLIFDKLIAYTTIGGRRNMVHLTHPKELEPPPYLDDNGKADIVNL